MNERIKEIRTSLGISQVKFAEALGVSISNIQSYEIGRRTPSEAFIKLICNKYDVNENWLRTGEGEMFAPKTWEEEVADITVKIFKEDNAFRKKLISLVASLSEEELDLLQGMAEKLLDESKK